MRRAVTRARLTCVACGDRAPGIELGTLSAVSAAGGPLSVDLCTDCVRELITLCQRNVNGGANASVNAASTQGSTVPLTLPKTLTNATENGGFNGCVSGSDLPLFSDPDSAPSEPQDQTRLGVEPKYPAYFEDFWSRCKGKKGNKWPAFMNFKRLKPPVEIAVQRWALWMSTTQWQRGASKHMEGWLTARGWEDEPDPSEFLNAGPVPFAVAAEDSRKERATSNALDRLREELRPKVKPVDPRQERREHLAAQAAGGTK